MEGEGEWRRNEREDHERTQVVKEGGGRCEGRGGKKRY